MTDACLSIRDSAPAPGSPGLVLVLVLLDAALLEHHRSALLCSSIIDLRCSALLCAVLLCSACSACLARTGTDWRGLADWHGRAGHGMCSQLFLLRGLDCRGGEVGHWRATTTALAALSCLPGRARATSPWFVRDAPALSCAARPALPGLPVCLCLALTTANTQHPAPNIQYLLQYPIPISNSNIHYTVYIGYERTSKPCPRRREKASSSNAKTGFRPKGETIRGMP